MFRIPKRRASKRAFTLIEVAVAASVTALLLAATFAGNGAVLRILRSQKQTVAAAQAIQERMEEIRSVGFSQVADVNYLQSSIFNTDTTSQAGLPGLSETVTVSAYPADGSASIQLTRQNGAVVVNSTNSNLSNGSIVRLDLSLTWASADGRQRIRQTSTLIGRGNIAP